MKLIYEISKEGCSAVSSPTSKIKNKSVIPDNFKRSQPAELPQVSELEAVRHYTNLSRLNYSVDTHFYPLGSCTMKYNPKICETISKLEGFADLHPLLPQIRRGGALVQGALKVIFESEKMLAEITGMNAVSTQPMAGANGELAGTMIMAAYHKKKGNKKTRILIPDSAHGTNPATASITGYSVTTIPSGENGCMDYDAFINEISDDVAGVMLTSPNTLGLFNPQIHALCDHIHAVDGLMYYDGANLNALVGKIRPSELGFDIVHLNMHKTFSTPHGGGGPGAGAVGVCEKLKGFLPMSRVIKSNDGTYALNYDYPDSIGYIAPFYGNFGILLRAYAYIRLLGPEGLGKVCENAVLNANYVKARLQDAFEFPYDRNCMHECVCSAAKQLKKGVSALDISKALLDKGFHSPTMYFPLVIKEALMIEPTETESKETLDAFVDALLEIAKEIDLNPESFKAVPLTTPVRRLDEVAAARDMILKI